MSMKRTRYESARWLVALAVCAFAVLGGGSAAFAVSTVTGTVVDGAGGPAAGADVAAFVVDPAANYSLTAVATATADVAGSYVLTVPPGTYLFASKLGTTYPDWQFFTPRRGGNAMNAYTAVLNTGRVPVADLTTVPNVGMRLITPCWFEGNVRSATSGLPLGNVVVSAAIFLPGEGWDLVEQTVTRPDGTYRLQTLETAALAITNPDPYVIDFSDAAGFYASQAYDGQLYLQAGRQFVMPAHETSSGIDASLTVASHITGTVTDAVTGLPVPAVSVEVFRYVPLGGVWEPVSLNRLPVLTDALGNYNWGGLPPGDYKVKFAGDPGIYGTEYWGGLHWGDPNVVPLSAPTISIASEGTTVTSINAELDLFDGATPLTTLNASTAWHTSPYAVSLDATDLVLPSTGVASGVAWTLYRIGAGAWTTGTAFSVSGEGTVTLQFRSQDLYGNLESVKNGYVRLDATPPTSSTDATTSYVNVAEVHFSATDNLSGIGSTWARVDSGVASKTNTVTVYGQGVHSVEYWSVDGAGNAESPKLVSFDITQTPIGVTEIAASDRVRTAIEVSKKMYPDGTGAPKAVVVANGYAWADGLGGAALAGAVDAPVLLVNPGSPSQIASELARLKGLGATRAFILGGTGSMPAATAAQVTAVFGAANTTRIGGADRYAVSRAVAARSKLEWVNSGRTFSGTFFVVSGAQPWDALAVSPIASAKGYPIMLAQLTPSGGLSAATRNAITALAADRAIIAGGTGSVPSATYNELKGMLQGAVTRVSGSDRYSTAAAVANWGVTNAKLQWDKVAIASGETFSDALAGAPYQGRQGSVLLLTPHDKLHPAPLNSLTANAGVIFDITFLGGPGSVAPATRAAVLAALR